MAAPYIPATDAGLDDWGANFSTLITATPSDFGLSGVDAAAIQAGFDGYHAAYLLGGVSGTPPNRVPVNPSTYTTVTVAAKNVEKFSFTTLARSYAVQIRVNNAVTNPNKVALRLNLVNSTPSPIPAPSTSPILIFIAATPGMHTLRFADTNTPSSAAKPQNVLQLQLFMGVSTITLNDPALCALYSTPTKIPVGVNFSPADAGKVATYFGRWATRKGLTGPWSAGISAIIPGA